MHMCMHMCMHVHVQARASPHMFCCCRTSVEPVCREREEYLFTSSFSRVCFQLFFFFYLCRCRLRSVRANDELKGRDVWRSR